MIVGVHTIGERAKLARHSQVCSIKNRDIREYGSTLYVELAHAFPPTNTKFKLFFSRLKRVCHTQTLTSTERHISSPDSHLWVQLSAGSASPQPDKNDKFLRFFNIIIRECGSTRYVGLAHAVPPTNTKFKPLLLPTQAGMPYTNTHKHRTSYFKSTLTFIGPAKRWSLSAARQKPEILEVHHI